MERSHVLIVKYVTTTSIPSASLLILDLCSENWPGMHLSRGNPAKAKIVESKGGEPLEWHTPAHHACASHDASHDASTSNHIHVVDE
jgi:hypothetical protein